MKTLHERFIEKVDKTGACWRWTGSTFAGSYGQMRIDGKLVRAHRISHELHIGPIPAGLVVDHRCHNTLCVKPDHLRAVTPKQNAENRTGARRDSASGIWGVRWHKRAKKWSVSVRHNGVDHAGGNHHDLEQAVEAAKQLRLSLFTCNDADRKAS